MPLTLKVAILMGGRAARRPPRGAILDAVDQSTAAAPDHLDASVVWDLAADRSEVHDGGSEKDVPACNGTAGPWFPPSN